MKRRLLLSVMYFALGLMLATSIGSLPAQAADSQAAASTTAALELLPDETLAALVVPNLALLDAKITGLGAPLQTPIPSPLMLGRGMIGLKDGLKEDGPVVLALVGPVQGDDDYGTVVGLVATSDYSKLIGQYSPQDKGNGISQLHVPQAPAQYAAQKNGWALFVNATDDNRKLLETLLKRAPAIAGSLAPLKSWSAQQDVAYVISSSGVKLFLGRAAKQLQALSASSANPSLQQWRDMLPGLISTLQKEIDQIGIGLRIDDDHTVRLLSRVCINSGSDLSKAAANISSSGATPLAGLPTTPFLFAMDGTQGEQLNGWLAAFSVNALKAKAAQQHNTNLSDNDWKQVADMIRRSLQASAISLVMGLPTPGKSVYSQMFALSHVENAQNYLKNYESSMTAYSALLKKLQLPDFPGCEVNRTGPDDAPVLEITTDLSSMLNNMQQKGGPQAAGVFSMLFGGEAKQTIRLTAADPHTIVMAWGDTDSLKTALEAAKSPNTSLGADVDIKATVDLMPKSAQWRVFISPSGYLEFVRNMMQSVMPQMPIQLPAFPNTPAIGLSAHLDPKNLDIELLVPAAVMNGIGTYMQQMQRHGP